MSALMTAILDAECWGIPDDYEDDCDHEDDYEDSEPAPASDPDAWSCRICDAGDFPGPRSECGCCGSAQCSVYCGCQGLEDYWCVDCGRAHANPCRTLEEADSESECHLCCRETDLDDDGICNACNRAIEAPERVE